MIRLKDIKINEDISNEEILKLACKKYKIKKDDVIKWFIYKKSIDARKKDNIFYNYTIDMECKNERNIKNVEYVKKAKTEKIKVNRKSTYKPVIIGAGPAGLFAALTLTQNGIRPIIIEQGKKVEERKIDVDNFRKCGKRLDKKIGYLN